MMDTEAPVCISRIDEGSLAACTSCFATVPTMRSQWHAMGCDWSSADPDVPGGMPQHYLWPWGTLLWHCCDYYIMKYYEKDWKSYVDYSTRMYEVASFWTCYDMLWPRYGWEQLVDPLIRSLVDFWCQDEVNAETDQHAKAGQESVPYMFSVFVPSCPFAITSICLNGFQIFQIHR